ncbi:SUMO2 [Candida oxycetoniae]|uniref:SUMO2 n=1 Tax=Candida oxycetoniae TaxID=497107 RepID=A0AAI9T070_9ASCO|nr:SUMO2 [Candida oxycetoniae]KAI3405791.2 SUMO2 [Candida oxycetoniae]
MSDSEDQQGAQAQERPSFQQTDTGIEHTEQTEQQSTDVSARDTAQANINVGNSEETVAKVKSEEKPEKAEQINLKVAHRNGDEMFFKIKTTTEMRKIMDAYSRRQGKDSETLRFFVDGVRIQPKDTPRSLGLEDGDLIDVSYQQIGGGDVEEQQFGGVEEEQFGGVEEQQFGGGGVEEQQFGGGVEEQQQQLQEASDEEVNQNTQASGENEREPETVVKSENGEEEEGGGGGGARVLILRVTDKDNNNIQVQIKSDTKMKKVMNAYCRRHGKNPLSTRFLVDGARIQPEDTPDSLGLDNDDIIEASIEQTGGAGDESEETQEEDGVKADAPVKEEYQRERVNIKVRERNQAAVYFKIKPRTPMKKVMEAYCSRVGKDIQSLRFWVDGARVQGTDTPESLGLDNEDCVDVSYQQTGGRSG